MSQTPSISIELKRCLFIQAVPYSDKLMVVQNESKACLETNLLMCETDHFECSPVAVCDRLNACGKVLGWKEREQREWPVSTRPLCSRNTILLPATGRTNHSDESCSSSRSQGFVLGSRQPCPCLIQKGQPLTLAVPWRSTVSSG